MRCVNLQGTATPTAIKTMCQYINSYVKHDTAN